MAELSPETVALERARRAMEEAERLREESRFMAAIARQRGYIVHPRNQMRFCTSARKRVVPPDSRKRLGWFHKGRFVRNKDPRLPLLVGPFWTKLILSSRRLCQFAMRRPSGSSA